MAAIWFGVILSLIVVILNGVNCQTRFRDVSTTTEESPPPFENHGQESAERTEQTTQTKLLSTIVDLLQIQNEQQNQQKQILIDVVSLLQKHDKQLENITQQQGFHYQEQKQQLDNMIQLQNVQNKIQGSAISLLQSHDKKLENVTYQQRIQNNLLSTMVENLETQSSENPHIDNSEELQSSNVTTDNAVIIGQETDNHILSRMLSSFQNYTKRQEIQIDLLLLASKQSPQYCSDIAYHQYQYGVFTISPPDGLRTLQVLCKFTAESSWIIFQRRLDGSQDFWRSWSQYQYGFGDRNGEHWLGLDNLYRLTRDGVWVLRIYLEDFYGNTAYAEYNRFAIGDESSNYTLTIGEYSGTAGDSLTYHKDRPFSTSDRDHTFMTCSNYMQGAWWFFGCADSNLNGQYVSSPENNHTGIFWKHWKGFETLSKSEMMIRRVDTRSNTTAQHEQSKSPDMTKNLRSVTANCADIITQNFTNFYGIYSVKPTYDLGYFDVVCNLDKDSHGWIVLQTRFDGSEDFYRPFEDYKNGFGNLNGEHWLGLEKINKLTSNGTWQLRIQLEDCYGNVSFAYYNNFAIGDESTNYTLRLGDYSGNAGDSLSYSANRPFSTYDRDHDTSDESCASYKHGAWWYGNCAWSNLNGLYKATGQCYEKSYYEYNRPVFNYTGVMWFYWKNNSEVFMKSEMKIRQVNLQSQPSNQMTTARDCTHIRYQGAVQGYGVYTIQMTESSNPFEVVCDFKNDQAWMVFQRRLDGSVNFYRPWKDYEDGFGEITGEHWLGLDKLHNLTENGSWQLRVDLEDINGNTYYAEYSNFAIGSEPHYRLTATGYSGNAGDHLQYAGNGNAFSTYDRDNDESWDRHCAQFTMNAWWYNDCYSALNGLYRGSPGYNQHTEMKWSNRQYSKSEMKIRRCW